MDIEEKTLNSIFSGINDIKTSQLQSEGDLRAIKNDVHKLQDEFKILKESQTIQNERILKLEIKQGSSDEKFKDHEDKNDKDKKNIYDNMDKRIKQAVKESIMTMKIWVYGGLVGAATYLLFKK